MKKKDILIVLICAIVGSFIVRNVSPNNIDAFVYLCFTCLLSLSFVRNLREYLLTRKGIFVEGTVVYIEDIDGSSYEDEHRYKAKVEFTSPLDNKNYTIEKKLPWFSKEKEGKKIRVWINQKRIDKSIPMDKFDSLWMLGIFQSIIFASVFFVLFVRAIL